MPELSTDTQPRAERMAENATAMLRRLAASALMVVGFIVTFATALVIALAALVVALIVAAGVGVMWLLARLAGPRRAAHSPRTLEARKGPRGWTVETRRFSF
jgi:hypothetical protein